MLLQRKSFYHIHHVHVYQVLNALTQLNATYTCSSCLFSYNNNKRHIILYNTTSFNQCTFLMTMSPSLSTPPPERDNCQPMAAFCLACSILFSYTECQSDVMTYMYSNYAMVTYIHVHNLNYNMYNMHGYTTLHYNLCPNV